MKGLINGAHFLAFFVISLVIQFGLLYCLNTTLSIEDINARLFYYIMIFVVCIPIHEILHGVMCCCLTENNWNSITIGINWREGKAYCQYQKPIVKDVDKIFIALCPGLILGIIPAIAAVILQHPGLCIISSLNIGGASNDILKIVKIAKHKQ